jgi:hypothetical protein
MKRQRLIHIGWEQLEKSKHLLPSGNNLFGKYQYIYTSEKGRISLIKLINYFGNGDIWEILCQEGDLFDDVERFSTKKGAEIKIKEYLD